MNHSELVQSLSKTMNLDKSQVDYFLRAVVSTIEDTLKTGEDVTLIGLGKLKVKTRAARKARNPSTGVIIEVPEKKTVIFTPTSALKKVLQ